MTWYQLAARSRIHVRTIARIEAGDVDPGRLTLLALAEATGEDPGWLAGFYPHRSGRCRHCGHLAEPARTG